MCDSLGFINGRKAVFGKNSDRSPNEPQVLEFIPASVHSEAELRATYISVPQVKETRSVLLSRPSWLWGAEIGVNDCGLCIGNEAVWTLGVYGKTGLTGMDLLRLALERAESPEEALTVITQLLEKYGQGGSCGYDHEFYYDNSFLIMNRESLYVLETSGRDWAYKKYDRATISNRLCIGADADAYSGAPYNFALRHSEHLYNIASGSAQRRKQTQGCISSAENVPDIIKALRTHKQGVKNPFAEGSVGSACMHFGGLVGDHTTASLVADLMPEKTLVWTTGSSAPCVSLFKPWVFGESTDLPLFSGREYWYKREKFNRALLGKVLPGEYYAERDELEQSWMAAAEKSTDGLSRRCFEEEEAFFSKWSLYEFEEAKAAPGFTKRWQAKTEVLLKECADII